MGQVRRAKRSHRFSVNLETSVCLGVLEGTTAMRLSCVSFVPDTFNILFYSIPVTH